MALNLSRIFRGRPDQVAVGDVNGDGPDAVHDKYANQEVSYIGETEKHAPGAGPAGILPYVEHDNVYTGVNDGSLLGITSSGDEGGGANARVAAPHGPLAGGEHHTPSALDAGFTISDDLVNEASTNSGGGKGYLGGLFGLDGVTDGKSGAETERTAQGFTSQTQPHADGLGLELTGRDDDGVTDRQAIHMTGANESGLLPHMEAQNLVTEIGFPKLDGSSKEAGILAHGSDGARTLAPGHGAQGFHIEIDGVSGGYLSSVAAETEAQYNPKEIGIDKAALEAQDGSGTDNANRTAAPGPHGLKFDTDVVDAIDKHRPAQPGWFVPDMDSDQSGMAAESTAGGHPAGFVSKIDLPTDTYTATDDLWKFRDTNQDGAAGDSARTAGPGHQGFMMQDGELYPRGLRDMEIDLGAVGEAHAVSGDYNSDGVVDAADYVLWRDRTPSGVKWEGPDYDASKNEGFTDDDDLIDRHAGTRPHGFQAMPELDANANVQAPGLDNGFDQQGESAGFRSAGFKGEITGIEPVRNAASTGDTTGFFKSTSGMDSETEVVERSAHHPGPAHFGDAPGLNGGDMMAKNEVSIESLEIAHEGIIQDGELTDSEYSDSSPGGAGHHPAGLFALPEVDDEVLVSFSSLDSDTDAPSTLVDLHTPGDVPVEHLQDHVSALDGLHDGHHDIGTHHGGHGHEGIIDHLPDIDL